MRERKTNKKSMLLVLVALLLVAAMGMGTIAWLTATSHATNTFTVGEISTPDPNPTDPEDDNPIDPEDPDQPEYDPTVTGNIFEPSWAPDEEHKLYPGVTIDKDPYVGVGAGSEESVVYVYVENDFSNKVYFTINEGWSAVDAVAGSQTGTYTSGLFKYNTNLVGSRAKIGVEGLVEADDWTDTSLFSKVVVDTTADAADLKDKTDATTGTADITVYAYIHQAKDADGNGVTVEASEIKTALDIVTE